MAELRARCVDRGGCSPAEFPAPPAPGGRCSGSIAPVLFVALTSFVDRTRLGVRVVLLGPAHELLINDAMKKAYLGEV